MGEKMSYAKGVYVWEKTVSLSQDSTTVDGGDLEELGITVHTVPGRDPENDKFIVLRTKQWALDLEDVDKFAEYLKSLIKN